MIDEDYEFNRIEREASMRKAAVKSTLTAFDQGRAEAFKEIAAKIQSMPFGSDTMCSLVIWLKEQE